MTRLSSVLSGYVAACAAGGLAAALLAGFDPGTAGHFGNALETPARAFVILLLGVLFVGFFLFLTIWPAALVLGTVGFALRIRSWLYYVLGGILAGLIGAWLITLNPDTLVPEVPFSGRTALANMAIGALMATVYWLVALRDYGQADAGVAAAGASDADTPETQDEDDVAKAVSELEDELKTLPQAVKAKAEADADDAKPESKDADALQDENEDK